MLAECSPKPWTGRKGGVLCSREEMVGEGKVNKGRLLAPCANKNKLLYALLVIVSAGCVQATISDDDNCFL